jgi:hypothetical protein
MQQLQFHQRKNIHVSKNIRAKAMTEILGSVIGTVMIIAFLVPLPIIIYTIFKQ